MTPKEKGIELRELFFNKCNVTIAGTYTIFRELSKEIAIAAVDEMISENQSILQLLKTHGDARSRLAIHCRLGELEKIKQAINQL